jgi:neutral trehalase
MFSESINEACTVYCEGDLLKAVQLAQLFNDSKTFVDMPMINDPNVTLAAFYNLTNSSDPVELQEFVSIYFLEAGSDLNQWIPTDFQENPSFLASITDPSYQTWGYNINQLWQILGREVNNTVAENPQRHSYLPRAYPMIVPGGRFRESYYWDSWWIIRGLLVCDMHTSAQYVINNLLDDVNSFGFVPNGGRIYYLDRSQPPLLSEMVRSYVTYMLDMYGPTQSIKDFVATSYASLQTEYNFWMNESLGHCVKMPPVQSSAASASASASAAGDTAAKKTTYKLNRYYSNYTTPRPESYLTDFDNAAASSQLSGEYYQQVGEFTPFFSCGWRISFFYKVYLFMHWVFI